LLLLHVMAVFAGPCAAPPPSSYLARRIAGRIYDAQGTRHDGAVLPYLQAAYLNHGYRFFAPNPGPSHLVRYEIEVPGKPRIHGEFPDPDRQSPRLLYHRYFMMSETVYNVEDPVSQPPRPGTLSESELTEFRQQRVTADALVRSIAKHLLEAHDGQRVRLFLREHRIPGPAEVLDGVALDDARLYRERPLGEFTRAEL
jgi:hypothetical protein